MNAYTRKIGLASGTIQTTDILPGDTIYCRHSSNNYQYEPSQIASIKKLFNGRIVQLTHKSGDITEHDYKSYAKLA